MGKKETESHLLGRSTQAGALGRIQMGSIESKVKTRRVEREEEKLEEASRRGTETPPLLSWPKEVIPYGNSPSGTAYKRITRRGLLQYVNPDRRYLSQ